MPPPLLLDLAGIDLDRAAITRDEIYQRLPHRFEFAQLDGFCHLDIERREMVAFRDIRPDEWWTRGHLPGQPIFPGVLMIETAAQMASYAHSLAFGGERFLAFAGVDKVKFRGTVVPPARLVFLGRGKAFTPRRVVCLVQALRDGQLVFEGELLGVVLAG